MQYASLIIVCQLDRRSLDWLRSPLMNRHLMGGLRSLATANSYPCVDSYPGANSPSANSGSYHKRPKCGKNVGNSAAEAVDGNLTVDARKVHLRSVAISSAVSGIHQSSHDSHDSTTDCIPFSSSRPPLAHHYGGSNFSNIS